MTTARPWLSGHCNASNPPEIHAQCKGGYTRHGEWHPCSCLHHMAPDPSPAPSVSAPSTTDPEAPPASQDGKRAGEAPAPPYVGVPGVHRDVDEDDYHRDKASLSSTGAKLLANAAVTAEEFRWTIDHPRTKKAFDEGHAAHQKILGVGLEIRVIPDSILATNGATSTKEAKAFLEQARADGAVPIKSDVARRIDAMALRLEQHAEAFRLLSSGEAEVSAWAQDPETGVMRRARADWLRVEDGECVDYKSVAGRVSPFEFDKTVAKFGYDQQDAWYRDVFTDSGVPIDRFLFIAQAKEPPYEVAVHELDADSVSQGRFLNTFALTRFADCIGTGTWPSHEGVHLIRTPAWRRSYNPGLLTAEIPADFEWSPDA